MNLNEILTQLILAMVPVLATALTGLIAAGINYLVAQVRARAGATAATKTQQYLAILNQVAANAVLATQQGVVDALKREGRWDAAAKVQVKEATVNAAVAALGDLRGQIQAHLKVDLPAYMQLLIERALADLKANGTIKPVTPAPAPVEPLTDLPTGTEGK